MALWCSLPHVLIVASIVSGIDASPGLGFAFGSNTNWQLGIVLNATINEVIALHPHPMDLPQSTPIKKIAAGITHTIALSTWGSVYRWGRNDMAQLGGLVQNNPLQAPEMLVLLESRVSRQLSVWSKSVSDIAVGQSHTLAMIGNNEIYAWGDNSHNQLGAVVPFPFVYNPPIPAPRNITNSTRIRANHTIASSANSSQPVSFLEVPGLLERPKKSSTPLAVLGITSPFGFKSVHAHTYRSAVLTNSGQVWVWGDNRDGLIGVMSDENTVKPTMVEGAFAPIRQLCLGIDFFVALDEESRVWVWGDNHDNQLGLGENAPLTVESPIESVYFREKNISNISCGYQHTILWNGAKAYAFGDNEHGQLGLGDFARHNCPDEIVLLREKSIVSFSAGRAHNIVVTRSGVLVWGLNDQGQLGMGDTTTRPLPTRLIALEAQNLRLSAAGYSSSFVWAE
eukprot:c11114_g1_i1.p1 GENE.c11114_g1_i1~~c11114_g1_i1.p1  ORF type:complete len:464 (-),score=91.98 c11114_g1_i1:66-1424(-)